MRSIVQKDASSEYHVRDHKEVVGERDATNIKYLLHLLARLLEGRPLKKAV